MTEPATIEQLPSLSTEQLVAEDGRIRAAIDDLFKRRRLVRTLIRGHERVERLIAQRDGKPEPASKLINKTKKPQRKFAAKGTVDGE